MSNVTKIRRQNVHSFININEHCYTALTQKVKLISFTPFLFSLVYKFT